MINWIKCSDRLPSHNRRVLGWHSIYQTSIIAMYMKNNILKETWSSTDSITDYFSHSQISHWAELTAPVEIEEKKLEDRHAINECSEKIINFQTSLEAIENRYSSQKKRIDNAFDNIIELSKLIIELQIDKRLKTIESALEVLEKSHNRVSDLVYDNTADINNRMINIETVLGEHIDKISHCQNVIDKRFERISISIINNHNMFLEYTSRIQNGRS